jgi:hypothetical protein
MPGAYYAQPELCLVSPCECPTQDPFTRRCHSARLGDMGKEGVHSAVWDCIWW